MKQRSLLAALVLFMLTACSRKDDLDLPISRERFIKAYTDIALLNVELQPDLSQRDSAYIAIVDSVLKADGVTREQFENSSRILSSHPQAWEPMLREILKTLEEKRASAQKTPS